MQPLLPQQQEALEGAVQYLKTHDRIKVLMACGSGKTRVGPEIALARGARTAIVFLPSLALVRQTLPTWLDAVGGMSYICACSDSTVAPDSDGTVVTEEDLGCPVTTDSQSVREFLEQDKAGMRVVFSTYQSSDVVAAGIPKGFAFDVGVFDEAHKTAGKAGMFSAPLDDRHISISKRVFFTATPKHLSYRKRDKDGEAQVVYSMDDESVYGVTAYSLPMRQAIQRGIIADYRVIVSVVDDQMISRDVLARSAVRQDGKLVDAESVAHAIAIREAMNKYGVSKVITFHDYVASADHFANHQGAQAELGIPTFHVNGSMQAAERGAVMDQFASGERGLVSNARCLTEGVDVPAVDMVAFLSPKRSQVDIIQAMGRAMRIHDGKAMGYVLLPLYVSEINKENWERVLKETGYDAIFSVVEALREQDEAVKAAITTATIAKGEGKAVNLLDDGFDVMGPVVHLDMLRTSISTKCIEVVGDAWDWKYGLLTRVYRETGCSNVSKRFVVDGVQLGLWAGTQRAAYAKGVVPLDRVTALEKIKFAWRLRDPYDELFEKNLSLIIEYRREHGHVNVPHDSIVNGVRLGLWVANLRRAYRKGVLTEGKINDLTELGFAWNALDDGFKIKLDALTSYYRQNGHVNIPRSCVVDGVKLGQFVSYMRKAYALKILSEDRIAALEKLQFSWNRYDEHFEKNLGLIVDYHREHGNVNVPRDYVVDGVKLGMVVNNLRGAYATGVLDNNKIESLEKLKFSWSVRSETFNKNLDMLSRYFRDNGHTNVPHNHIMEGIKLGVWTQTIRRSYANGKLSQDKVDALRRLNFKFRQDGLPVHFVGCEKCELPFLESFGVKTPPYDDKRHGVEVSLSRKQLEQLKQFPADFQVRELVPGPEAKKPATEPGNECNSDDDCDPAP